MTVLVDTTNLFRTVKKKFGSARRVDYHKYFHMIDESFGTGHKRIAYVSYVDVSTARFVDYLRTLDVIVRTKKPRKLSIGQESMPYINWNVELTLDALESNDVLIIGSNNLDLVPLVNSLKKQKREMHFFAVNVPPTFECPCGEVDEALLTEEICPSI